MVPSCTVNTGKGDHFCSPHSGPSFEMWADYYIVGLAGSTPNDTLNQ
jgi:hypothetical protein